MEHSTSTDNLHFPMSIGNVRNLARLFEDNSVSRKPNFTLTKSKSKSYSSVVIKKDVNEVVEQENPSFRDIYSKFESGKVAKRSIQRIPSVNRLECIKLQEIKEIKSKTDEIETKVKTSKKGGPNFYITNLNEVVEMLLQIGQIETDGNSAIQTEKLATLQVLQKCYSQLRGRLEQFLGDDTNEGEEQKTSIRSSIQRWENMIDPKTQYEIPNYSTHFTNGISSQRSVDKPETNDVIRCSDTEDDSKMVEHVKVQNLKNIWERRLSEDAPKEESHIKRNGEDSQFEDSKEKSSPKISSKVEIEQVGNKNVEEPDVEEEFEKILAETIEEPPQVVEETPKATVVIKGETLIPTEIEEPKTNVNETFLEEERKHTEDPYSEEQRIESKVVVEYAPEPDDGQNNIRINEDNQLISIEETEGNVHVEEEIAKDTAEKREVLVQSLIDIEDEGKEESATLGETAALKGIATSEETATLKETATLEETTTLEETCTLSKTVSSDETNNTIAFPDGNTLSKLNDDPKSSTTNFLNEERKHNDRQLEDIDPLFGPPTGIVPDPTQNYEQVQIVEGNTTDDQLIVIYEKQEGVQKEETQEADEWVLTGDNVHQMVVKDNACKEENYLILDNRSVEEIEQAASNKEETVLVNGDKM